SPARSAMGSGPRPRSGAPATCVPTASSRTMDGPEDAPDRTTRRRTLLTRLHDALRLRTSPVIFFGSAAVILAFVLGTILFTDPLNTAVSAASDWLLTNLGWFYILGVTVFLAFLVVIAVGRFGRVKLGPDDEPPEHSGGAW